MRVSSKIYWTVGAGALAVGALFITSSYAILERTQAAGYQIVQNEFLEATAELVDAASPMLFSDIAQHIDGEGIDERRANLLRYVNSLDVERTRIIVVDRSGRNLRPGQSLDAAAELLTPDFLDDAWRRFENTGRTGLIVENYTYYLADDRNDLFPVYFRFEILEELGMAIGYGRELRLAKIRLDFIRQENAGQLRDYLLGSVSAVAIAMLLSFAVVGLVLKKTVLTPLDALVQAIDRVAGGDLDQRVPGQTTDELGDVARAFNAMAASLETARSTLRRSEDSLSTTLDSIGDAVIATDSDGRIVRLNPVAETLTGWSAADALDRSLDDVFVITNAYTREPVESPVARVLRDGAVGGLANHTVLAARGGESFQIADSGAPIRNRAGEVEGVVLVFRDVTESYAMEEQLRHAQKMEAVGKLAGGVAHDFNNLLFVVLGYVGIARKRAAAASDAELREDLDEIEGAAKRAAELTRQLLIFGRAEHAELEPVDLGKVVRGVEKMVRQLIPSTVSIRIATSEVSLIEGKRSQLERVVTNVCVNARDAMPQGGTLELNVENAALDAEFARAHAWAEAGTFVRLSIADTGKGIAPEVRERMFEPFYTTKSVGQATGLGLSVVYGVVKQHNGLIDVESVRDQGTTFSFYFPTTSRTRTVKEGLPEPAAGGGETVLLAEDDERVRRLTMTMLEEAGYRVIAAADGEGALRKYREHGDRVDLILLDVVMPGIGGIEAYAELQRLGAQAPVIFITGYSDAAIPADVLADRAVLNKPYDRDALLRQIRESLK